MVFVIFEKWFTFGKKFKNVRSSNSIYFSSHPETKSISKGMFEYQYGLLKYAKYLKKWPFSDVILDNWSEWFACERKWNFILMQLLLNILKSDKNLIFIGQPAFFKKLFKSMKNQKSCSAVLIVVHLRNSWGEFQTLFQKSKISEFWKNSLSCDWASTKSF